MKRFVTVFPAYRNIHFYKDPGQIPYRLKKFNFQTSLLTFNNEKLDKDSTDNLEIKTIPSSYLNRKFNFGLIFYILKNRKSIQILNLFHLDFETLILAFFFKLGNKKGITYLKMDNCHYSGYYEWEKIWEEKDIKKEKDFKSRIKGRLIRKRLINCIDFFSIEDVGSKEYYSKKYDFFKEKLFTSLNGHTVDLFPNIVVKNFSEKDNVIVSAGSLGFYQKATEVLLEAFVIVARETDWNLHLAGSTTKEFDEYMKNYFVKNPMLKDRVFVLGLLHRSDLFEIFNKSKIFCLPSRYEGFANVFAETMYLKNALVTTPYVAVKDIIVEEEVGVMVEKDDTVGLGRALLKIIQDPLKNQYYGENGHAFAKKHLNWDHIVNNLVMNMSTSK